MMIYVVVKLTVAGRHTMLVAVMIVYVWWGLDFASYLCPLMVSMLICLMQLCFVVYQSWYYWAVDCRTDA